MWVSVISASWVWNPRVIATGVRRCGARLRDARDRATQHLRRARGRMKRWTWRLSGKCLPTCSRGHDCVACVAGDGASAIGGSDSVRPIDAGHFIWEDADDECAALVTAWWSQRFAALSLKDTRHGRRSRSVGTSFCRGTPTARGGIVQLFGGLGRDMHFHVATVRLSTISGKDSGRLTDRVDSPKPGCDLVPTRCH